MIIYVPKKIETVEDARELPSGTVVCYDNGYEVVVGSKVGINAWETTDHTETGWDYLDSDVVGWTALTEVNVLDSLASVIADRSEFHTVDEVRRRLKEQK